MTIKTHLESTLTLWPDQPLVRFMLENARNYAIGPQTFSGPRGEAKACFKNATHLALENPSLTYVEGKVGVLTPVDHAWCITPDGVVVDPTLDKGNKGITDGTYDRITEYYGVPFHTDYLRKAIMKNGNYGLLDGYCARHTLPILIERGLEAGQMWLLRQRGARSKR
jgi:hypothetical protein